jgi:hypothetical protein
LGFVAIKMGRRQGAEKSVKLAHEMLTGSAKDLHDTIQAELINKDDVDKYIDLHKQLGDIK